MKFNKLLLVILLCLVSIVGYGQFKAGGLITYDKGLGVSFEVGYCFLYHDDETKYLDLSARYNTGVKPSYTGVITITRYQIQPYFEIGRYSFKEGTNSGKPLPPEMVLAYGLKFAPYSEPGANFNWNHYYVSAGLNAAGLTFNIAGIYKFD